LAIPTDVEWCSPEKAAAGLCPEVANSGTQVDIGASETNHGDSAPEGPDPYYEVLPPPRPIFTDPRYQCIDGHCNYQFVVPPDDLTVEDIASFRPEAPTLTGEPTGFGVVGAPTNVVAAASEQYLTGPLLDWNVTVRFTPAGYVFDYGDGATERLTTGGATWASLAQAQFTPTATSHVYRERGTYPVGVTVQYTASVDFGSGTWRPVTGYVTAQGGGYDIRVVEARTALVDKTCAENPSDPGC
jgi:hypothetical protein